MKKITCSIVFMTGVLFAGAQIFDSTNYKMLDVNNIKAKIAPSNIQFLPELFHNKQVGYAYPADMDSLTTIYSYALWIGGKTSVGETRVAAEKFHQEGFDFQAGPMNCPYGSCSSDPKTVQQWSRVWKLSASEIQTFLTAIQNDANLDSNSVPEAIRTWPAHGDATKGQLPNIAPFFDNDGDGIYNWRKGDYPLIKGDQSIFFVFNDLTEHTESKSFPMKIEIHAMAYAFGDPNDTAFWNSMFFHYTLFNRSVYDYYDAFIGAWADIEIGYGYNDYIGCDVEQGMFFGYNAQEIDGYGEPRAYPAGKLPAQGIAILGGANMNPDGYDNPSYNKLKNENIYGPSFNANYPDECAIVQANGNFMEFSWDSTGNGDMVTHNVPVWSAAINGMNFGDGIIDNERMGMTRFVYYNNAIDPFCGDPQTASDYYNYLRAIWKNNAKMTYGGTGYNPNSTLYCNFMFPGNSDPCNWGTTGISPNYPNSNGWTEEAEWNQYGDRRGMGSSGPFTFKGGSSTQFDIALISGMENEGEGRPYSAVETIKRYAAQIRTEFSIMPEKFQNQEYGYVTVGIPSVSLPNKEIVTVYPNPANTKLYVKYSVQTEADYTIYNIVGQIVLQGKLSGESSVISIESLAEGMYYLRIAGKTVKFVKE